MRPGQRLGSTHELRVGDGAYEWGTEIRAAVVGRCSVLNETGQLPVVSVAHKKAGTLVPTIGETVTCRVSRIASRMATVEILCVGIEPLSEPCAGLIRREDVRDFDLDKVAVHTSFRPGDIVQARVLSLGDARAYLLTTAAFEFGVVSATSTEGAIMVPISLGEMECPLTKQREPRKVARAPSSGS